MTRKRILLGLAIVLVAAAGVGLVAAVAVVRKDAVESPQRALLLQAEDQLAAFYAQHGQYPESLDELTFASTDGGDASTLATLPHRTDGAYYRIVTKSVWDGSEVSVCH